MLRTLWILASNTFRETVRDKILYNLVFFAIGLIAFSLLLGEWSLFARENVIKDFALAVMSLFGLLMAIFIGIGLIQKEIQRKTVLTLLARPFPRWQFIVGKYLGLLLVLAIDLAAMTLALYFVLWQTDAQPTWRLLNAVYLTFIEMAVITAAALLFSSFSTPVLSALFTFGLYVAGHLSGDLINHLAFIKRFGARLPGTPDVSEWQEKLLQGVYYLIPNLDNFNLRGRVVYNLPIPENYLLYNTGYGLCFIAAFLIIACLAFQRRDFI
jgi:Cu-processing system permease protein